MPSAMVGPPMAELVPADAGGHRRVALGLHADELDAGRQVPGGDRHPRQQAAAADGHDQRVEVGVVGQHLQRAGPLPGDDRGVVEGVDVGPPLRPGQAQRLGLGLGDAVARQHDRRPQLPGALHLHERRDPGHDDGGVDAQPAGVVGDGLGVVAGRHGHHAPARSPSSSGSSLFERTPLLERRHELQVLELHHHRRTRAPRTASGSGRWACARPARRCARRRPPRRRRSPAAWAATRLVAAGGFPGRHVAARSRRWLTVMSSRASGPGSTPRPGPLGHGHRATPRSNGAVRSSRSSGTTAPGRAAGCSPAGRRRPG